MTERFLQSLDDIREEQEALLERQMDPDMALVSDYAVGALSDDEAAKVRRRIQEDPDFRDLAEPLLLAYEHRTLRPRLSDDEQRRSFAEICRRVGIAPAAPADPVVGMFQREVETAKRQQRRRRMLFAAVFVLLMALPPFAINIVAKLR